MPATRLADWGPTPETLARRPNLKLRVGAHQEHRLAAPPTGTKQLTRGTHDSGPKRLDQPATRNSDPKWPAGPARLRPKAAGSAHPATQAQSWGPASHTRPRPKAADRLINTLAACKGPNLQLLHNPCEQSPAGPTGSLGLRQNTHQSGAAGLGETAWPRKTRPSRGLNYPIAASRAPSI